MKTPRWDATALRKAGQSRAPERPAQAFPRAAGGHGDAARLGVLRCRRRQGPLAHPPASLFPAATSAVELREYFIPDFSHWKEHDKFEAAFERLLKDLRCSRATGCTA